ncbi:MAG: M56 family metallopeptidase [Bacteroidales bacterium]|nr:M56 family metallopeptidase [Bacteroidales bacterium]
MTQFLLYIARVGLYLGLFYAFYLLVMRRTTFFRLNRVLLLAGSYLCLLLPFIRLRTETAEVIVSDLTIVGVGEAAESTTVSASVPWREVLLAVYVAGALVTLIIYMVSSWKMGRLIRNGNASALDDCRLVLLESEAPSFSWGRTVVMSRKDMQENPAILTHERMHVKCRHSLDLILFLPLQILFWWNPLVWITREELRLLHEYEADEGVIKKGIDATQYQLLLVRKAVGEHRFSLASGFQHAKLKNRITMMLKKSSSRWVRWSYLAVIPVLAVLMYACNSPKESKSVAPETTEQKVSATTEAQAEQNVAEAVTFDAIEVKPTFNGGDAGEFVKWAYSQLNYPEKAKKDKAQGRVLVQFTIGTDGSVSNVELVKGVREDLNAEVLRVVSSSPKWEPGKQNGEAVPVRFSFPVVFKLQ